MPNPTFFNLPEEKREQIVQIAMDEFAGHDYEQVSVSRIVARAGIAKGSFYQYFADKEDLYAYLFTLLAEAKTRFFSLDHPDPQHIGVFAYMRWLTEMSLEFQLTYPRLYQIGVRAVQMGTIPERSVAPVREQSMAFYRRLVELGKQQGDIAPDVDEELAAHFFEATLTGVSRYVFERVVKTDPQAGPADPIPFDVEEMQTIFSHIVDILEHGMGRRSSVQGGE